jgi:transcriptional regulator with XRE-family HTH domain
MLSWLELARRQRRLTQESLATQCGIHQTQIGDLEKGRRPSESELRGLEKVFSGDVRKLLDEVPESVLPVKWKKPAKKGGR